MLFYKKGDITWLTSKPVRRPPKASFSPLLPDRILCNTMTIRVQCSTKMEEKLKASSITSGHLAATQSPVLGSGSGALAPPSAKGEIDASGGLGGSGDIFWEGSG